MQKFVPRSRVGIFAAHPIHPIGPKLTFWCVSYHLGPFGTAWLPCENRCKTGRTSAFVPRSRVGIFCNERTRSNPLDPKLTFWCVSYHLGAFGTVWLPYKTCAKRAELVQKFVPRSYVGIFRDEHTRSNPLDPKLMFWCVSYHLGAFRIIWLP